MQSPICEANPSLPARFGHLSAIQRRLLVQGKQGEGSAWAPAISVLVRSSDANIPYPRWLLAVESGRQGARVQA